MRLKIKNAEMSDFYMTKLLNTKKTNPLKEF